MTIKKREIIEKINKLSKDFEILRKGVCTTESDYEYLEEHLDKAFACIPNRSEFPSQMIMEELNRQIIIKAAEKFYGSFSEGKDETN